jgi:hypothetical protein
VDREEGDALEFELVQVQTRPGFDPRIHRRAAFSALFRGPIRPVLPQRIYRLTNETLGTLELFLVPIGPDADGMRYEAVFN